MIKMVGGIPDHFSFCIDKNINLLCSRVCRSSLTSTSPIGRTSFGCLLLCLYPLDQVYRPISQDAFGSHRRSHHDAKTCRIYSIWSTNSRIHRQHPCPQLCLVFCPSLCPRDQCMFLHRTSLLGCLPYTPSRHRRAILVHF